MFSLQRNGLGSDQKACRWKSGKYHRAEVSYEMHHVMVLGKELERPWLVWYLCPLEINIFPKTFPPFLLFHDLVLLDFLLFTLNFLIFEGYRAWPPENTVLLSISSCSKVVL